MPASARFVSAELEFDFSHSLWPTFRALPRAEHEARRGGSLSPMADCWFTMGRVNAPLGSTPARPHARDPALIGMCLGILSAAGYTGANIFLRDLATQCEPAWVSCVKALPTAIVGLLLIARERGRRSLSFPTGGALLALIATGLLMQLGGNVSFQWALSQIGLAVTVPLVFGALIITGALWSRLWLGELVAPLAILGMGLLIMAVTLLSLGAETAALKTPSLKAPADTPWLVPLAIAAASLSGFAYAACNVVLRRFASGGMPICIPIAILGWVGVVSLAGLSFGRIGLAGMLATTPFEWAWMILAGCFNAIAFFSLGKSLQLIPVARANALNASQVAMCAVAGVMLFHEPVSGWLLSGVALTIAGLMLSQRGGSSARRFTEKRLAAPGEFSQEFDAPDSAPEAAP